MHILVEDNGKGFDYDAANWKKADFDWKALTAAYNFFGRNDSMGQPIGAGNKYYP